MNKEERLREYINKDYSYINYKTGVEEGTDFDKFCIQHCKDIEELLEENQKYKEVIDKLNDLLIIKKERCLNEDNYVLNVPDLDDILQVLKEVE